MFCKRVNGESQLKGHTKHNFGKDKQLWREWIQANASKIERELRSHGHMKMSLKAAQVVIK